MSKAIDSLGGFLNALPLGAVEAPARTELLELLTDAWDALGGNDQEATKSDKLHRWESPRWNGRDLLFELERHGQTVNGSSRASVHVWKVTPGSGKAIIVQGKIRRLRPQSAKLDTDALVASVFATLDKGGDAMGIEWVGNGKDNARLSLALIIPAGNKQTQQSRNSRFRNLFYVALASSKWEDASKGNRIQVRRRN